MKAKLLRVAILFAVAGCESPWVDQQEVAQQQAAYQQAVAAADHQQCISYGFTPGTDAYAQCRLTLAQMRFQAEAQKEANRQQGYAALAAWGRQLQQQSQPRPLGPAPSTGFNCTTQKFGNIVRTNCN